MIGATSCASVPVPGDVRRFDPFSAFPLVAAFAGGSARLIRAGAHYVREDGTVDLEASYIPEGEHGAYYSLVRPVSANGPIGAAAHFQGVAVWVRRPGFRTERSGGPFQSVTWDRGMTLEGTWPADDYAKDVVPAPTCSLLNLWSMAKQHGASGGAVAVIVYDRAGYDFKIAGTSFHYVFDTECHLKNG